MLEWQRHDSIERATVTSCGRYMALPAVTITLESGEATTKTIGWRLLRRRGFSWEPVKLFPQKKIAKAFALAEVMQPRDGPRSSP